MAKDRTGEDRTDDTDAPCPCKGTGWLTKPNDDHPRLCPRHRQLSLRRMRPVREYFDPIPSDKAAAAIDAADAAERAERAASRGHNVESPVTLGNETTGR